MKKYIAMFLSAVLFVGILSSCSSTQTTDGRSENYFTTTASPTTTRKSSGRGIGYFGLEEAPLEYTGEPVKLTLEIDPDDVEIAMVLFVDGFLQPYSIDGGEIGFFHTVATGMYTLTFHPISGNAGETVQFVSRILDEPDLDNPENQNLDIEGYYALLNDHFLKQHIEKDLIMKVDAPAPSPEVASDLTYTQDVATIFRAISGVGDSPISKMPQTDFIIYDTIVEVDSWLDVEYEDYDRQSIIIAEKNTEHEIFFCGYGKTGKYRVSLFINNELQYAFDGKAYLDMEIVENKQTTCSLKINTEGLNKNNYIYLMYCPIDLETDKIDYHASKTFTTMFLVE
ncbi:MAG: hypothetical protein IKU25_08855 [Clostridia bacterium]|nr:hypothetical protein [Clostridia bacterium]